MATFALCNIGKLGLLRGEFTPSSRYKIALFTDKADIGTMTISYSSVNEASGDGYIQGGYELGACNTGLIAGSAYMSFDDVKIFAASFSFRYGLVFTDKSLTALCFVDFGESINCDNEDIVISFPPITANTAFIRIP